MRSNVDMDRTLKIRTLLICLALIMIVIPIIGAKVLNLLEFELVRRTEAELIAQAAVYARAYINAAHEAHEKRASNNSGDVLENNYPALEDLKTWNKAAHPESGITPVFPVINPYRDPILPPPPDPKITQENIGYVESYVADKIQPLLEASSKVTLAGVRVLDYRGIVIATTGAEKGGNLSDRYEVRAALKGRYQAVLRFRGHGYPTPPLGSISRGGGYRVYAVFPVVDNGKVLGAIALTRTPLDTMKVLYFRRRELILIGLVIVCLAGLSAYSTSLLITKPILEITRQANKVSGGDYGAAKGVARPVTSEAERLSKAFSSMADSLEERANYFRAFAYNVSHEFKTPLTSMRGSVELLEDHMNSMSEDEKTRFLSILRRDLSRLEKLMNKLLELARADTSRPKGGAMDVVPELSDIVEDFRKRGLNIELTCAEGSIIANISDESLRSVISNLLENSWQHGGPDVSVNIIMRRVRKDGRSYLRLEISDNGVGIPEKDRERIFDRFYTTNKEAGGTGLGLSIVKTIVESHSGTIELGSNPDKVTFIITMPCLEKLDEG